MQGALFTSSFRLKHGKAALEKVSFALPSLGIWEAVPNDWGTGPPITLPIRAGFCWCAVAFSGSLYIDIYLSLMDPLSCLTLSHKSAIRRIRTRKHYERKAEGYAGTRGPNWLLCTGDKGKGRKYIRRSWQKKEQLIIILRMIKTRGRRARKET